VDVVGSESLGDLSPGKVTVIMDGANYVLDCYGTILWTVIQSCAPSAAIKIKYTVLASGIFP
jgi:hypothetical protein